jgi:hypothetical protein
MRRLQLHLSALASASKVTRALGLIVMAMLAGTALAQPKPAPLYTLATDGWQRANTPNGEVLPAPCARSGSLF